MPKDKMMRHLGRAGADLELNFTMEVGLPWLGGSRKEGGEPA